MPYISEIDGNIIRKDSFQSGLSLAGNGVQRTGSFDVLVVADNKAQNDLDILANTPNLPLFGDQIGGGFVNDINFSRSLTHHRDTNIETFAWLLSYAIDSDIDVENIPRNSDGTINRLGVPGNPIFLPADFDIGSETIVEPFEGEDAEQVEIKNFFGEPIAQFDRVEREREVGLIKIERWGNWPVPLAQVQLYNNSTNETDFHGLPAGTCWMQLRVRKQYYHGVPYAREIYRIRVDDQAASGASSAFIKRIPHRASVFLGDGGTTIRYRDSRGNPGPFNIRSDGTLVEPGEAIQFLEFKLKREVDWSPLNLPNQ